MKKQLTANQVSNMVLLCSIGLKIAILPGYMSSIANKDFWLVTIVMTIFELLSYIAILEVAKKIPNKTFFQVLEDNFNFPVRKIVEALFFIFFILKTILNIYECENFIKETIYEDFNEWIFLPVFLLFIIYVANKDFNVLGRSSELVVYLAYAAMIISLMLSIIDIDISNILPIMPNGILPLFKCSAKSSFWFGDYLIFLLLMGNIKYEKGSSRKIIGGYVITISFIVLYFITFNCLFNNTTPIRNTAISDVSHYIPHLNDFRLDWLSDILWVFVELFTSAIWFFMAKITFCNLFGIDNKNKIVSFSFAGVIIFLLNVLQLPVNKYVTFLGTYCVWITGVMSLTPLFIIYCYKIGKRRKYYENALEK